MAIEEEVDALVLAGDLLDSSRTFVKEKLFLQSQLNRLAPFGIPVIVALGNHDAGVRTFLESIFILWECR